MVMLAALDPQAHGNFLFASERYAPGSRSRGRHTRFNASAGRAFERIAGCRQHALKSMGRVHR
jgi:hypothetical protein